MHPYTVLQIICTGFFFPPSFHFFHILLSYINTPQTHNLPSPGPVLHFHHPHKFSGKPELESNLSKLFWHTTKPKAMSCHATWTQQPLVLFTGFVHCSFLELSEQRISLQHSQHRMSWGRHFQSNLSLCALACSWVVAAACVKKHFQVWKLKLKTQFKLWYDYFFRPHRWQRSRSWGKQLLWQAVCATGVLCHGPGTEQPVQDTTSCTAQQ